MTRTFAVSGVKSDGCNPSSGSTTAVTLKFTLIGMFGTINGNYKTKTIKSKDFHLNITICGREDVALAVFKAVLQRPTF